MVHNKLLHVVQAHLLGFSTGSKFSGNVFLLVLLFHTSFFIVGCLVQLVSTKFPSRVVN